MKPTPEPAAQRPRRPKRRLYKVERLSPEIQILIFDGYARGDSYAKIASEVSQPGHSISPRAVGRYWNDIWREEHERLRQARANLALLKRALQLDPKSPCGEIAEELLYTIVFDKMPLFRREQPLPLLREAREQEKIGERKKTTPRTDADPSKGASLKQRLEQLYGPGVVVEEEVSDDEPPEE